MTNNTYSLTALGFLIFAFITGTSALTGFAIADTPGKTGLLGMILFVASILTFFLGRLKESGLE